MTRRFSLLHSKYLPYLHSIFIL